MMPQVPSTVFQSTPDPEPLRCAICGNDAPGETSYMRLYDAKHERRCWDSQACDARADAEAAWAVQRAASTVTSTRYGPGGICCQSGAEAPYSQRRRDQRGKAVTATCPVCGRLVGLDSRARYMRHLDMREAPDEDGSLEGVLTASIERARAQRAVA